MARICRSDLIVVDDIGMLPAGQEAAEAFYRVVDAAYERRSVAVTTNLHPSGFDTIMPKTLATATVDRLLHHAHVVLTEGASYRLAEATAGKGVVPLGLTPTGDQLSVHRVRQHGAPGCPPTGRSCCPLTSAAINVARSTWSSGAL